MSRSTIADAPSTGIRIAETSDFDRASGLLALTSSGSGHRRSGFKQIERRHEGGQKFRWHDYPPCLHAQESLALLAPGHT